MEEIWNNQIYYQYNFENPNNQQNKYLNTIKYIQKKT